MSTEAQARQTPSFCAYLAQVAKSASNDRKGPRTRKRIRAAASELLEEHGYHGLRMGDVAEAVGLSHGAIYRYYGNKQELTRELLTDLAELSLLRMMDDAGEGSLFQRRQKATRAYVDSFAANLGLMRCIRQLADEIEEFRQIWLMTNARWYRWAAEELLPTRGSDEELEQAALDVVHALGAMVDEFLYEVFVRKAPTLEHLRSDLERLTDLISILWFRGAHAQNPPRDEIGDHPLLHLHT